MPRCPYCHKEFYEDVGDYTLEQINRFGDGYCPFCGEKLFDPSEMKSSRGSSGGISYKMRFFPAVFALMLIGTVIGIIAVVNLFKAAKVFWAILGIVHVLIMGFLTLGTYAIYRNTQIHNSDADVPFYKEEMVANLFLNILQIGWCVYLISANTVPGIIGLIIAVVAVFMCLLAFGSLNM